MSVARWAFLGALAAATLIGAPSRARAADSGVRIGYVDMKRLLDQAPQVLAARARLQKEFSARDASLSKDETRLAAMKQSLADDRATLSTAAIAKRQQAIDVLAGSVRRARTRMQQELKTRSDQELDRSWQTISNAAVEYARRHDYDLVLPSPVIYASPAIDITDAVLAKLRREQQAAGTP